MSEKDFLIASQNSKKREELQRILAPLGVKVKIAPELGLSLPDVEETGETFEENALLKAISGCRASGLPCIADDSGLEVDALNGAPGIYSARYAGEHGNDGLNTEKLLHELKNIPFEKRSARFVCAACCAYPDGRETTVRGECEGFIAFEPRGSGGFGYDPVFLPADNADGCASGRTMAELPAGEKDKISHRGKALKALAQRIGVIL